MSSVLNDWIPTAAFIEYHVLNEAIDRDITISNASSIVVPRFGLQSDGPFLHKQTRLLAMLYTLLVFPREQWKRDGLIDIVVERALADRNLIGRNKKLISSDFLRSVRNAMSHARIEFGTDTITFRDGRSESDPTFDVKMTMREALNMLLVLGRAFHESAQVKDQLQLVKGDRL